jgi:hypothetical protein
MLYVAMACIYSSSVANGCIKVHSSWKCRGTFSMLQWLRRNTSAVHPLILQFGFLSCTVMQQYRVAACRTAVQHVVSLPVCSWAVAWWSHRLAGLALLLFLPAHVAAQTAITDANLNTAVIAWVTNPTTATITYGPIADWNTAAVSNMASLLYPSSTSRPTFSADISKWNVASVSNMYSVCAPCLRPCGIFI